MTNENQYDVIIIGAGQCGTSLAYYFDEKNISYIILEKDRAYSAWYSRWDNFFMNTANWMNLLSGMPNQKQENDNDRCSKKQIINHFENWLLGFACNIIFARVTNIKFSHEKWLVNTKTNSYSANYLIVASGPNKIVLPEFYDDIPKKVEQLHSSEYKNSRQIITANIIIVGTGSSGVQICEDLAKTGRYSITLSCSKNRYFSWTLFGISIYEYVRKLRLFDITSQSLFGRFVKYLAINKSDPATPPRPKELHSKYNVKLQGKIIEVKNNFIVFEGKQSMNLDDTTIIWCTGFKVDLNSIFDESIKEKILYSNGFPKLISSFESAMPNLYFIGLRFQRLLSSHTVYGSVKDAKQLAIVIINKIES